MMLQPHESGMGVLITPPTHTYFRVWRTPGPTEEIFETDADGELVLDPDTDAPILIEERDVPVLSGYVTSTRRLMDWDTPVDVPLRYRIEISDTEAGPYAPVLDDTLTLEPNVTYSALEDGGLLGVASPRDALVVYLSWRLASLARQGVIPVRRKSHKRKFPVVTSYSFNEADLPVVAVHYAYGRGHALDLGSTMSVHHPKIGFTVAAADKPERDALTRVFEGLIVELESFLVDLGCDEVEYGEMAESVQQSDPYLHLLELALGMTRYVFHGHRAASGWTLIPTSRWVEMDGSGVVI